VSLAALSVPLVREGKKRDGMCRLERCTHECEDEPTYRLHDLFLKDCEFYYTLRYGAKLDEMAKWL
jgi:hypothetical protein